MVDPLTSATQLNRRIIGLCVDNNGGWAFKTFDGFDGWWCQRAGTFRERFTQHRGKLLAPNLCSWLIFDLLLFPIMLLNSMATVTYFNSSMFCLT